MDISELIKLAETFGPTPAFLIVVIVALVMLWPMIRREGKVAKHDLVTDREVLEFIVMQRERNSHMARRLSRLEDKCVEKGM